MIKRLFLVLWLMQVTLAGLSQNDVDTRIAVNDAENPNTFVLIIANEHYKYEQPVPFALNDGETFRLYCEKTLGIPEKNIRFVADATLNDMRMQLTWLQKVMSYYKEEAHAIVYYSGHGMPSEDGRQAYLLPVDGNSSMEGSALSTSLLYKELGDMPSAGTLLLLDACFSGARRDGQMLVSSRGVAIKAKEADVVGNLVVFSAAKGDETAYPYTEKQHGLFTYFVLKQLQENGGQVTLGNLVDNVTKQVERTSIVENNKSQTPTAMASPVVKDWRKWVLAHKRATRIEKIERQQAAPAQTPLQASSPPKVHRANANEPILPDWMKQPTIGQWVGAAPPTPDMNKGRGIALINAALGYLRSQQAGKMQAKVERRLEEIQKEDNSSESSSEKTMSSVRMLYSGFTVDVIDEYYNSRGEYFVRCSFNADRDSENQLLVMKSQTYQQDKNGKHQEDNSLNAKVDVLLKCNGQVYSCSLTCLSNNLKTSVCQISVGDMPFRTANSLKYENMLWNKELSTDVLTFTKQEIGQSLGIMQLAAYTLLPFIPRAVKVNGRVNNEIRSTKTGKSESRFEMISMIIADTICYPTEFVPMSISSNGYAVKVHDTNMADVDFTMGLGEVLGGMQRDMMIFPSPYDREIPEGGIIRLLLAPNNLINGLIMASSQIQHEYQESSESLLADPTGVVNVVDAVNNLASSMSHFENKLRNLGVRWDFTISNRKDENWHGTLVKMGKE